MDYIILSAIMAVVFGATLFNKKNWGLSLIWTAISFVLLVIVNILVLPIINLSSFPDIWIEYFIVVALAIVIRYFMTEEFSFWRIVFLAAILLTFIGVGIRSIEMGQSDKFCNLIKVDTVTVNEFNKDIFPTTIKKMICVDETMAKKAAQDLLDTDPGLGSRVYVGEMTMQPINGTLIINGGKKLSFDNSIIWVAPLEHNSFRKWWINNTTPGYVIVDATDASLTKRYIVTELNGKKLALRYIESGCLWDDIEFHIKINGYVGKGLNDHRFEIDNSGTPFWVLSAYETLIGFSAKNSQGAITVDAQTGELKGYSIDAAPEWVDRIQPENFILDQITWWGKYQLGWINSWWDQINVQQPTAELTLVYSEGKSFWYTGIQSAGKTSESSSGFMLINTRNKSAKYYKMAGVNEMEAMKIANDIPFASMSNYLSNKPVLYNLRNVPSYFMVYKGDSGNATGYAFVSVGNRSIFGAGATQEIAEQEYLKKMTSAGVIVGEEDDSVEMIEGDYTIKAITLVGQTFYLRINELPGLEFYADNSCSADLKWSKSDEKVRIKYGKGENKRISLNKFSNLDLKY